MTQQQFLADFAEIMGVSPGGLNIHTELAGLENWDSVAYLSTIVLLDEKCGVTLTPDALLSARTVQDIVKAAGPALE